MRGTKLHINALYLLKSFFGPFDPACSNEFPVDLSFLNLYAYSEEKVGYGRSTEFLSTEQQSDDSVTIMLGVVPIWSGVLEAEH